MSRSPRFPLVSYSSFPRSLLTSRSVLATGTVALTLLILFAAGIRAHNAHRDRSTTFANAGPRLDSFPPNGPTPTPTPAVTPTPMPDCLNTIALVSLIDRPVSPLTDSRDRNPPRPSADGSVCLTLYERLVESAEPATCIVMHEATPAQLCIVEGGYQYYFIGTDETLTGPFLAFVDVLSGLHPTGTDPIELYRGQNPLTSKLVVVEYLPDLEEIRISTYYADTETSTDKPYVFTVSEHHGVTHVTW